ncbi:MAG: substrate-binding domain-containing protein [Phycisphaerae bacterium]|nr:substrate-binding domain-containing protein [Phycisphaerae bacterium]
MLPKKKGVPYFTSCAKGAEEAAKELGVELIYDGPTDGAPEKAASMIERWTAQGVDAIAVSPNDPNVLAPAMRAALAKGIKVLTWDADGLADSRAIMVSQATSREIGFSLVDTMAKDLTAPGADPRSVSGEVAIITASLTAANQNEWIAHMKERLRTYPGLTLVDIKPGNEDQRLAFQAAKDLMAAYPALRGIWGISSVSFPAAAEAVKQSGRAGKVLVTGLSTPNDMKSHVHDGTVTSVILWNTMDLGYLTIHAAVAQATGALRPGAKALHAGRLGPKAIEGDKLLLGDILVFTKSNIDQFDF